MKKVNKLKLTELEQQVLSRLTSTPAEQIKIIPVDLYYTLLAYCEQEEDYEKCILLRNLSEKVSSISIEDFTKKFLTNKKN